MSRDPAAEDVGMMRAAGETRKGDWMETFTGRRFYPLDPRPEEVSLVDIAWHLTGIDRYNGAMKVERYSVAEHSVLMAHRLWELHGDHELCLQALLHDSPEAYIGDMIRPLKRNMPQFTEAELVVWTAIAASFNLPVELDERVHAADNRILVDERAQVMNPSDNPWGIDHLEPLGVTIQGWNRHRAYGAFTRCYFNHTLGQLVTR